MRGLRRGARKVGGLRKLRTLCLRACEAGGSDGGGGDAPSSPTSTSGPRWATASCTPSRPRQPDVPLARLVQLGNAGLRELRAFPRLTSLDLSDIDVPLLSTEWVASLTSLTSLNLFYSGLTDAGVALLPRCATSGSTRRAPSPTRRCRPRRLAPVLRSLDLFGARITDAGLESLGDRSSRTSRCGGGRRRRAAAVATLSELRSLNFREPRHQ